jgi:hypothetical protein
MTCNALVSLLGECTHLLPNIAVCLTVSMLALHATHILLLQQKDDVIQNDVI